MRRAAIVHGEQLQPDGSTTTFAENITFMKQKFSGQFDCVHVIARETAMKRVRFLYDRLWPEIAKNTQLHGTPSFQSLPARMMERMLVVIARIDAREKYILRIPKLIMRNKSANV